MIKQLRCCLLATLSGITACGVHTINTEVQPQVAAYDTYANLDAKPMLATPWWDAFERPTLDALIRDAFDNSQTIAEAQARVVQAQALLPQSRSRRLPEVSIDGSISEAWRGSDRESSRGNIGGALSWELDAFNRLGYRVLEDQFTLQNRLAEAEVTQLQLSVAVANAYFGAVAAQRTLRLLQLQAKGDQYLLSLLQLRFDSGIGTNVEVLQQQGRVADSESLIPLAQADLRVFENRLDVLLGGVPDGRNRVASTDDLVFDTALPAIGVPADLLVNRPDLRAARAELLAADAAIGAAIAERFPQLTLEGDSGYVDTNSYSGPLTTLVIDFVQPLLDWGRRRAVVTQNRGLYEERLAIFTQRYLEAVESVENVLYQENRQREFIERLEKRRRILKDTVTETEARYSQGVDDYLPVINALQELREVERRLLRERLQLVVFRIQLYQAVGGPIRASNA